MRSMRQLLRHSASGWSIFFREHNLTVYPRDALKPSTSVYRSGIGGGGFMTVRIPTPTNSSEVWTIDFRETAPALSNTTMFVDDPYSSMFGGLSVGVPGEVRGLAEAHKRWGSLPWSRLVQPSAALASGWKVGRELGLRLEVSLFIIAHLVLYTPLVVPRPHTGFDRNRVLT